MSYPGGKGVHAAFAALAAAGVMIAVGDAGAQSQGNEFTVGIRDTTSPMTFTPADVTVSRGDTVTWDFAGSTSVHNVASANEVPEDESWAAYKAPAAGAAADGKYSRAFPQLGVYEYYCELHPEQMRGKVTVVAGSVATPAATPRPLITATPIPPAVTPPAATRDTPAPTPKWAADKTAPALTKVSGARSGATGAKVKWTLSESAALTLKFTKGKSRTSLRTVRLAGRAGTSSLIVRGGKLVKGRYNVQIDARDRAGNRSTARTTVRIGR